MSNDWNGARICLAAGDPIVVIGHRHGLVRLLADKRSLALSPLLDPTNAGQRAQHGRVLDAVWYVRVVARS